MNASRPYIVEAAKDVYAAHALAECVELARKAKLADGKRSELADIRSMRRADSKIIALAEWARKNLPARRCGS